MKYMAMEMIREKIPEVSSAVTQVNDKTSALSGAQSDGHSDTYFDGYKGKDWTRYYGAFGDDLVVSTGMSGNVQFGVTIKDDYSNEYKIIDINKTYTDQGPATINKDGNYTVYVGSGDGSASVIGGAGGSSVITLGKLEATMDDPVSKDIEVSGIKGNITAQLDNVQFNGDATKNINGSIDTVVNKDANVIGWTNGSQAIAVGGNSVTNVTGSSSVIIDGTNRRTDIQLDTDNTRMSHVLNMMKDSGVNAIGVTGGGAAVTTLGGTAESTVGGSTAISVDDATVIGVFGGGAAASVDATGVLEKIYQPGGQELQLGNDNGTADINGAQIDALLKEQGVLGPGSALGGILGENSGLVPDDLTITATDVINGGTATSTTGDTEVILSGKTTAAGVLGGGAAVASHTYTWKNDGTNTDAQGYTTNDEYGTSIATATTGKSTITVALDSQLANGTDKQAMLNAVKNFAGQLTDSSKPITSDVLKDFANKGAAVGVFGGGAAIAQSGNRQFLEADGNQDDTLKGQGAYATATTAGTDIYLVSGYAAGVMGGGIAGAVNNATAKAEMTAASNITVGDGMEAVGLFGNGLAYYTGSSDKGASHLKGTATVTAEELNFNILGGSVDGIIGGGLAIDDSQADVSNAFAKSKDVNINISGGTTNNVDAFTALKGIFTTADVDVSDAALAGYADSVEAAAGDAAIAAGGIALGGGASSEVTNAVVNIAGGEVTGNVYGGGIAAYGYAGQDSAANGGSRVDTSTINLTGGKVDGNVYAGGAAATKASDGATDVYSGYDKASATVGTSTVNLAGTDVTGVLYGTGTVNQEVVEETDTTAAQAAVDDSTLNLIGENTLSNVTVNSQESSKIQKFDNVNAAAGSVTKVTGLTAGDSGTALIDGGKVTVADSAKLDISELTKTADAYHIAANTATDSTFWSDEQFVYDRTEGFATGNTTTEDDKTAYDVTYKGVASLTDEEKAQAADSMAGALHAGPLQPTIQDAYNKNWDTSKGLTAGGKQFFSDWSKDQTGAAYGRGVMIGEDAAVTGNTVSIARDMADNVMQRLSFTDDYVQDAGWVNNDGGIWAKYIHRKYETDGMGSSFGGIHSSTDYDGAIVGVDFQKSGKFQSGIAFHYGSGDGDGVISRNDYDAWGFTLYGSVKDEEAHTNLMADIGYVTSDNDIDGTVAGKHMSADRDVDAWTIGLRGEKEYVFGQNQLVPYVGLRYMSVNPARYSVYYDGQKAFNADADNQNLWLLPIGVSFRNETKTDAGWRITPKLDLSYIWAFGDTDTDMTIDMGGVGSGLYYDVMDDNSWLASLGVEASKDVWSFGVGYGYQKGDDTKNKTWYVNASYAF